ncbi:MAG: 5'-methylthioadenosine/S-adenosylhomocysteine nucleosidase [Hoeflea sp.]|uniref:5'-methylthioadenosine/S-adenosylhomocysteine nucleosidase n=1 Tax=Hoeflea sp. TaxID=1940281 RepID=UPI003EF10A69
MSGILKTVGDRQVLYVMAAEPEYGPHLKARFEPLITGVGPVEAAAAVAAALSLMDRARPDCVVCLGSAGSRTLEQTGVYQVFSVSYRDMDASPLGFEKGRTPFLDLPAVLPLPVIADGVPSASLSTGANIVSGAAYDLIDADMVDMETFAVLRAASRFGVPVIGLRGISDGKAELNHIDDWTEYLHIIDEKLAQAVDRIEQAIASGAALA